MKHTTLIATAFALALALASASAQDPVVVFDQDFDDEFAGPAGGPGGLSLFTFSGVSGGVDPLNPFPQEVTTSGGVDDSQAFQIAFDNTGLAPDADGNIFFFSGIGFLTGAVGEVSRVASALQIEEAPPGTDNPANFRLSVDINLEGAVESGPILGEFVYFDPFFDTGEVDGLGNPILGAETYVLPFALEDTNTDDTVNNGFTTNTFTLDDAGAGPAFNNAAGEDIPVFNDNGNFVFRFDINSSNFGVSAENAFTFDNLLIEFVPPEPVEELPGDFNGDGVVDTADFVTFRDAAPGDFTPEDFDLFVSQFNPSTAGTASSLVSGVAVPEPTSAILVMTTGLLGCCLRRRR